MGTKKNKKLLLTGLCAAFVLFVGLQILHTCVGVLQEANDSAPTQIDESKTVETEGKNTPVIEQPQYIPFEENGKTGVKDASGKIIIPAEYDGESLYIDEVEDGCISAKEADSDYLMRYFKMTGQLLKHIDAEYQGIDVVLFHFADTDTHAFYTKDGQIKASGLSGDIFCLRNIAGESVVTYYGFRNINDYDNYMPVYDEKGNLVCKFNINGWQLFGLENLERNEDEPRDFEKEFTFTIDINDFVAKHRSAVQ